MGAPDTPRIGDVVAAKYRLDRELGAGAMGVLYVATHLHLNEPVALKMILPEAAERDGVLERFKREGQLAFRIKSEHIARVIDLGILENGAPYMAMELLHGEDIEHVLERTGALPVPRAVDYVLQACEAIAEAHALGMVHRDLKPANLFLTKRTDGTAMIKVLDFGLSKSPDAQQRGLTANGMMMGSPSYMSPEQVREVKTVDARSDIWAIGMILYELLTARVAFEATSIPALFTKILSAPPRPITELRPELPPALASVVMSCLANEPGARPQSIGALVQALAPFAPSASQRSVLRVANFSASHDNTEPFVRPAVSEPRTLPLANALVRPSSNESPPSPTESQDRAWAGTMSRGVQSGGVVGLLAAAALLLGFIGMGGIALMRREPEAAPAAAAPAATAPPAAVPVVTAAAPSAEPETAPAPSATPVPSAGPAPPAASASAPPVPAIVKKQASPRGGLGSAIDTRK